MTALIHHAPTFVPERCNRCGRPTGAVANLNEDPAQLVVSDDRQARVHAILCPPRSNST